MTTPVSSGGWTSWFTAHLGLKFFSVAAAITLYAVVHGTEEAQRTIDLEVVALLPSDKADRMLTSETPEQVKVTIRGNRTLLYGLKRDDFEAVQVDLRTSFPGYYAFEPQQFDLPAGLQVVQVTPPGFSLRWAKRRSKVVSLSPSVVGQPATGHRIGGLRAEPETITLHGPEAALRAIKAAEIQPVDVTGLQAGTHTRRATLDGLAPYVTSDADARIRLHVEVEPILQQRRLRRLEVTVLGGASATTVRPRTVDVIVTGPADRVADVSSDQLVPTVDLAGAVGPGATSARVQVSGLPAGVELVRVEPSEVFVATRRR